MIKFILFVNVLFSAVDKLTEDRSSNVNILNCSKFPIIVNTLAVYLKSLKNNKFVIKFLI